MFAPTPAPEPDPDRLDEKVNWLTYSHAELYRMVNEGVDLAGATDVSARWATLGEDLEEISRDLATAVAQVEQAWEGSAADSARDSVNRLVQWATDTGTGAVEVSGCITREINNAVYARRAMPEPPHESPFPQPDHPVPLVSPNTFSGGDFGSASAISVDNTMMLQQRQDSHRQAAGVMAEFQSGSREVYGTVPQFASPVARSTRSKPNPRPQKEPKPQPTSPQQAPAPTPGPAASGSGYGGAASGGSSSGGASGTSTPRTGAPAPGRSPAPAEPSADRPAAASANHGGGRSAGGGMMPGMGAGRRGDEDDERTAPDYLEQDDDIWGVGQTGVAPPVIGDPNGA